MRDNRKPPEAQATEREPGVMRDNRKPPRARMTDEAVGQPQTPNARCRDNRSPRRPGQPARLHPSQTPPRGDNPLGGAKPGQPDDAGFSLQSELGRRDNRTTKHLIQCNHAQVKQAKPRAGTHSDHKTSLGRAGHRTPRARKGSANRSPNAVNESTTYNLT